MATAKKTESENKLVSILNKDSILEVLKNYIVVGEEKFCLPVKYDKYKDRIRKFTIRDDDVLLAALPKSGTTWATEMIWLIVSNLDYQGAKEVLQKRNPLMEFSTIIEEFAFDLYKSDSLDYIENLKSPRCFKTHLPFQLLPEQIINGTKKPMIICVIRNPQDVCISLYHHALAMKRYRGSFEDFCELFLAGKVPCTPYWENVLSYWRQRHNLNILFIKFKEMKNDLPSVIRRVANFLNKNIAEDEVEELVKYLRFDNMKKNPAVNFSHVASKVAGRNDTNSVILRSGKDQAYKNIMDSALIERFEALTKEKTLGTGFEL